MRTLTIGEVLNRLKDEFDDITISKIRFLEAEGLISPDRTESGYRKFTAGDIDRLRYILRAQRDRYLPLKVIGEELARLDAGLPAQPVAEEPDPPAAGTQLTVVPDPAPAPAPVGVRPLRDAGGVDVALSGRELAETAGLSEGELAALRDHGLLGPGPHHDGDDLVVATQAATLLAAGLEPRHLRMYRQFAERESGVFEQLIAPLLRQRNPESRRAATDQADRLTAAGSQLQRAMLARELRSLLRS